MVITMFTATLDALLFFMVSTAVIGWLGHRFKVKLLVQIYALVGIVVSGVLFYLYDLPIVSTKGILIAKILDPPLGALLTVDMVSVFMITVYFILGIFVAVYSVKYMEKDSGLPQYYVLLIGMMAGMVGVVSAGDFFTFFIFWELMSITSYVLVAFRKTPTSMEAGFKYLIISSFGAGTILFALSLLYGVTGTLNFAALAQSLHNVAPTPWLLTILAMIVAGFGIKAAIVPLHTWLPDAHSEAPSSISALLSGVLIETGIYAMSRVLILMFNIQFRWDLMIAVLAIATMTTGNIMALLQKDIKRLLAYSSIAQIGYMLIGLSVAGSPGAPIQASIEGLKGLFMHIFNHSLMKGLAFLSAGALIYRLETRNLDELKGIGRLMPVTCVSLTVSLLALGGVPTLNGFVSKYTLFLSAFEGNMPILAIAGILNSGLSMAYYLRIIQTVFLAKPEKDLSKIKEAPTSMLVVFVLMTALIIFFGIWPQPLFSLSQSASTSMLRLGTLGP